MKCVANIFISEYFPLTMLFLYSWLTYLCAQNLTREAKLEDDKGLVMPAMTVFSESIRCLKDHMIRECNERTNNTQLVYQRPVFQDEEKPLLRVEDDDVFWVLTVPAIWDDAAKQFMREAAVNVNIYFDACIFNIHTSNSWIRYSVLYIFRSLWPLSSMRDLQKIYMKVLKRPYRLN